MAFSSLEAQSPSAHSARHPSLVRVPHPDLFSLLLSYPYQLDRDLYPRLSDLCLGGLAHRDDGSLADPGRACVHPFLFHSHVCLLITNKIQLVRVIGEYMIFDVPRLESVPPRLGLRERLLLRRE